jgi:AcrR family transcriptional regulator
MTDKSLDRRVARTRRALQNSLIQLILNQGYDSVTIENITDHADLGRTTFYLHYKDKEDLFMQAIDSICEDFLKEHENVINLTRNPETDLQQLQVNLDERILYHIFTHAQNNADLYRVMLRGEGGAKASQRITNIIKNETRKRLQRLPNLECKIPIEVFAMALAGTLTELVIWWLEEDQPFPIEEMVVYIRQLFIFGALDTFNFTQRRGPHEELHRL